MDKRIFLVEDEIKLNTLLTKYLELEGYQITSFYDGQTASKCINHSPDLWILDIMLPDMDGYQLIKEIKDFNQQIPVIFISARNEEVDRLVGLKLGSDDYLAKPFLPQELVIRTNNLFRRIYPEKEKPEINKLSDYILDYQQRTAFYKEEEIILTRKEFDLLHFFSKNKNIVVSREQILLNVWGDTYFGSDRVVDDTLRRIRKKLELINIVTIYGIGYKLVIK
ncbi:response regulator transcription factor [Vallitalea okinawensis]|uniref:response regulator transcription factor n=1 Tax=Vallitalea okinawensis TaxID=2078660 RepID=UPI000CFD430A|nr:response regulator transcription factor [Vallitalea okinawensis]